MYWYPTHFHHENKEVRRLPMDPPGTKANTNENELEEKVVSAPPPLLPALHSPVAKSSFKTLVYPALSSTQLSPSSITTSWTNNDDKWNNIFQRLEQFNILRNAQFKAIGLEEESAAAGADTTNEAPEEAPVISNQARWDTMFEHLKRYQMENGNCNVPYKHKIGGKSLGSWVAQQRFQYRKNDLPRDRMQKLSAIGFVWKVERMDRNAESYHHPENNNSNAREESCAASANDDDVTSTMGSKNDDAAAAQVTSSDPSTYRARCVVTYDDIWGKMLDCLKHYREEHGDCNVPRWYKKDMRLARWVNRQRTQYNQNKLSQKRVEALESIGFVWRIHGSARCNAVGRAAAPATATAPTTSSIMDVDMLHRLQQYRDEHGDCNVPPLYKKDTQLASWVHSHRERAPQHV